MESKKYLLGEEGNRYEVEIITLDGNCCDGRAENALIDITIVHIPSLTMVRGDTLPPEFFRLMAWWDVPYDSAYSTFNMQQKVEAHRDAVMSKLEQSFSQASCFIIGYGTVLWEHVFDAHRNQNKWEDTTVGIVMIPHVANDFLNAEVWVIGVTRGNILKMLSDYHICKMFLCGMDGGAHSGVELDFVPFVSLACAAGIDKDFEDFENFYMAWGARVKVFSYNFDYEGYFEGAEPCDLVHIECERVRYTQKEIRLVGTTISTLDHIESPDLTEVFRELCPFGKGRAIYF